MTPIDEELRTALHERARSLPPPADPLAGIERRAARIRRRRVTAAVAGSALAVTVVAVGAPLALDGLRDAGGPARGPAGGGALPSPPSGAPTPSTETPPGGPGGVVNFIDWPSRVSGPDDGLTDEIIRQWSKDHHTTPAVVGMALLWRQPLPQGGGVAGIWQLWQLGSRTAYTVVGQRSPDGRTFIVLDQITPGGVKEISSVLSGGAFPHVVVLGPPATGQISYAPDGRRFRPVEHLQGFTGGDGWAVFDRTGGGQQLPDLIEVLDGDGGLVYRGQIDVGPSSPDV